MGLNGGVLGHASSTEVARHRWKISGGVFCQIMRLRDLIIDSGYFSTLLAR
jgi:hypothetical protein